MSSSVEFEDQLNETESPKEIEGYQKLIVFFLVGFFIIYYMVLLFYHYSRRNLFPISERSSKLTLIDGICSMIFVIIVLISSYIMKAGNYLISPNLSYCGIPHLQSPDIYNTNQVNTIKAFQFLNNFIKFFKLINYLLRTFRLSYVFYSNLKQIKKFDSMVKQTSIKQNNTYSDINMQQNQQNNQQYRNQRNYNINQVTHTSEFSHNISDVGQQSNQFNTSNNQRTFNQSLVYSNLSFSNESPTINNQHQQSILYKIFKNEYILILISCGISAAFATLFYFIPSSSPFIFWNIYFHEADDIKTHFYDNYIFIGMNFFLLVCTLLCLNAVENISENYKIKHEIYFMLAVFVIFGNTMQFQCPEYPLLQSSNFLWNLIPLRLLVSIILDFLAINIEMLLPIIWATKERPWFFSQIVQDDITFFCIKYKNFQDYLFYQQRKSQKQFPSAYIAQNYLPEILNLFLEMKNPENIDSKLQKVQAIFQNYPQLIETFRHERVNIDEIYEIENGEVLSIRENITVSSYPYQCLYQKCQQILYKQQKMFQKTPQFELLHKRYQVLNQISLNLQEFKMTGDDSN